MIQLLMLIKIFSIENMRCVQAVLTKRYNWETLNLKLLETAP